MDISPEFVALGTEFVKRNLSRIIDISKGIFGQANQQVRLRLKNTYSAYIESAGTRYGRARSFFSRSEPLNMHDFYVPLVVACGEQQLESVFLSEIEAVTTRAVITGTAVSVQSMLLRNLFVDAIVDV